MKPSIFCFWDGNACKFNPETLSYSREKLMELSDEELILTYRHGSDRALSTIFDRYFATKNHMIRLVCPSLYKAFSQWDVNQIYFNSVYKAAKSYAWKSSFHTFLVKVAHNEALSHAQRNVGCRLYESPIRYEDEINGSLGEEDAADPTIVPEPVAIVRYEGLWDAIASMGAPYDPRCHDVAILLSEGHSIVEICEKLGLSRYHVDRIIGDLRHFIIKNFLSEPEIIIDGIPQKKVTDK